ncbi:apolipoprotein A-I-like [Solea solea]|uniref:apolipoprotein A-I-like n=1 Tax=Solea solea TaxID=90069 RepID=UPI00272D4409|nr:apolipoprotein A-I-like [Solea solea]
MKFVALALTLLLAVGSQAATLQADVPNTLQHVRSALDIYLKQVKDTADKAVGQLDDAEYKDLKVVLHQRLNEMVSQIEALRGAVSPVTDSVVSTISDATVDLRTSIMTDIETLKADIEVNRAKLDEVVRKHIDEYHVLLKPIIEEYKDRHAVEMEAMKLKIEPVVKSLREKIAVNVEETKNTLEPIVESVRAKLTERLEGLKDLVEPYVDEYKEQVKTVYAQAQSINAEQLQSVKDKIQPLTDDIKLKLQAVFGILAETFAAKE